MPPKPPEVRIIRCRRSSRLVAKITNTHKQPKVIQRKANTVKPQNCLHVQLKKTLTGNGTCQACVDKRHINNDPEIKAKKQSRGRCKNKSVLFTCEHLERDRILRCTSKSKCMEHHMCSLGCSSSTENEAYVIETRSRSEKKATERSSEKLHSSILMSGRQFGGRRDACNEQGSVMTRSDTRGLKST